MLEVRVLPGQLVSSFFMGHLLSSWISLVGTGWFALLAQLVEAVDLGSIQCGFESRGGHLDGGH